MVLVTTSRDRSEIQRLALALLNTPGLEVAEQEVLLSAILWYVEKSVDFFDAYNAAWMVRQGIGGGVYTFDRRHFGRFEGMNVLTPEL